MRRVLRKCSALGIMLMLILLAVSVLPVNVSAASEATSITPSKGQAGQKAVIHGDGLKGGGLKVTFGEYTPVTDLDVKNDKVVKITVPVKSPTDPDPVPVKIFLDGALIGELGFDYMTRGPEPVITGVEPPSAQTGMEFKIEITGKHFTTGPDRMPEQVFMISPDGLYRFDGIILEPVTDKSIQVLFPPIDVADFYTLKTTFTDDTGHPAYHYAIFSLP